MHCFALARLDSVCDMYGAAVDVDEGKDDDDDDGEEEDEEEAKSVPKLLFCRCDISMPKSDDDGARRDASSAAAAARALDTLPADSPFLENAVDVDVGCCCCC